MPRCDTCTGEHEQLLADAYFDFKGWRFKAPFHCMCCGKEICWRQWAFGRYCGTCDTGSCQTHKLHQMQPNVFCGPNTEMIDQKEAEYYRFTPERMKMIPPAEPMEWRKSEEHPIWK